MSTANQTRLSFVGLSDPKPTSRLAFVRLSDPKPTSLLVARSPTDWGGGNVGAAVRRRSSLMDLSNTASRPALMQIVGSICKDGLWLIGWWK